MVSDNKSKNKEPLLKLYYIVFGIYAIAPISLLLFVIDLFSTNLTGMLFWVTFLYIMLPMGLCGIILSFIGWRISVNQKKKKNMTVGIITTFIGVFAILAGLLGWLTLYVVLGG